MTDSSSLRLLSRTSLARGPVFTATQAELDGAVVHALEQSANFSTVASIFMGTGASQLARTGILALGANATGWAARGVQVAGAVGSLGAEVMAFEGMNRFMIGLISPIRPINLWRWNGEGGWRQGLFTSGITFTSLRGAGWAARGQNIVFQHTAQSLAMVSGHNIAGAFHLIPPPEGSFSQQLFQAEITNIELAASMGAFHAVAPGVHAFGASLDLANRSRTSGHVTAVPLREGRNPFVPETAEALAGNGVSRPSENREPSRDIPRPLASSTTSMMIEKKGEEISPPLCPASSRPVEAPFETPTASSPSAWPQRLIVNGAVVERNSSRLDRILSLRANRPLQAEKLIPLFAPDVPGYRLGELSFSERASGDLEIEGEIQTHPGGIRVAYFKRVVMMHIDAPRPVLIAMGDGLDVHGANYQGQGLGSHIVSGELLFYREMGVSTFFVPVSRFGPRFWPGRGFDFVDEGTRTRRIQKFHEFLAGREIVLSPGERVRLNEVRHSWELSRFSTDDSRPVGKEFLQPYEPANWMTRFDLHADYPGWRVLRNSLRKSGAEHRLPPELGQDPALLVPPRNNSFTEERPERILLNGNPVPPDFQGFDVLQRVAGENAPSPAEALSLLFRLPAGFKLSRLSFKDEEQALLIQGRVVEEKRRQDAATFQRAIYFSNGDPFPPFAKGRGLDVVSRRNMNFQGRGIGTLIALNELLFFRALRILNYEVPVGKRGGVFWPNLGFDFAHWEVHEETMGACQSFLQKQRISLSPQKQNELDQIRHAWELLDFTLENGRPVGREFLLDYRFAWDSIFVLSPSYPGWARLRRALEKIGASHLLPDELGRP